VAENLQQQEFRPPAPNRCWAGDITYIRTTSGWRYLAVWIDLYSRRVVGWKLEQLLIHTDQGSQYRATDYRTLLQKRKIHCSMSAKGCCWGKAVEESFFSTLKLELSLDDHREGLISPQQLQPDRLRAAVHRCLYTHPCEPMIGVHEIGATPSLAMAVWVSPAISICCCSGRMAAGVRLALAAAWIHRRRSVVFTALSIWSGSSRRSMRSPARNPTVLARLWSRWRS
jgi:transposase InsO family protein